MYELIKYGKGKSGIQKKWVVEMEKEVLAFLFRRIRWNERTSRANKV